MSFKITIEETRKTTTEESGPYTVTGYKPNDTFSDGKESVFGYPPKRLVEKEVLTVILSQTVDSLDLPAVIKAINKL